MIDDGMGALEEAVDGLRVPAQGDAIVRVRQLVDRLEAKVAAAEARYCAEGGHHLDGYATMAAFARHRSGVTVSASRRIERRARRLGAVPALVAAWQARRLSGTQVELVCAIVPDRHVERFAELAEDTISILEPLSAHHTTVVLHRWVSVADADAERAALDAGVEVADRPPARELSASRTLDGRLVTRGELDPDAAAVIEPALAAATRPDRDDETRTPTQRRADALVEICRHYLAQPPDPARSTDTGRLSLVGDIRVLYRAALRGAGVLTASHLAAFLAERPELGELERGLFLDAFDGHGGLAHTLDGHPVTDALVELVATSGTLERILTAGSQILDMGRAVRTFTPTQRRAVLARDQGCRSPGCHAPPEHCDIHHVVPWEAGGATDITNAVAKCRHCHHDHHRRGWADHLHPDGTYSLTTPTGHTLHSSPPDHPPSALRHPHDPPIDPGPRQHRRPRCDCPCDEHPTTAEHAEHERWRRHVLRRIHDDGLHLGA